MHNKNKRHAHDIFMIPNRIRQKICSLRGWPVGHAKNSETHESMLTIWEGLRSKADKDNDGQVSVSCARDSAHRILYVQ